MTLGVTPGQADLFRGTAALCEGRVAADSVYGILHRECFSLFPDEMFADLFEEVGRRSVPPVIVAVVMVLQRIEGCPDREAADRFAFDARWKYAAGGPGFGYPGLAHTVLADMRARLARSEKPGRIFDVTLEAARQAGLAGRRRVPDSTPLYDAVATMDTVTLVRPAIRGLLRAADAELAGELRAVLRRDDDYAAAGRPACDYDDAAAREQLVDALARDARALLGALDGREPGPAVVQAAALLASVTGQDLEEDAGGVFRIARRVAPDRVISAVDPQALRIGSPASSSLSQKGTAHATLARLSAARVPTGVITPVEVLVHAADARAVTSRLAALPGVYLAAAPAGARYRRAGTAVVDVLPVAETSSTAGRATLSRVGQAAARDRGIICVGGTGIEDLDFGRAVYGNFAVVLAIIGLVTFLLLTRALRSVVLAIKAVLLNLVSVGSAYGILVFVWQEGHGSNAIWGVPATGSITIWVPVAVFAFLFGLSMDYEVFILTRIREAYDATGSTAQAITTGIGRTGRLVTSAALILFLAFVSLASNPEVNIKILATGLGAGILVDALVIRSVLVPALVAVFGEWNWYLPDWLGRLLRVDPSLGPARPVLSRLPVADGVKTGRTEDVATSRIQEPY